MPRRIEAAGTSFEETRRSHKEMADGEPYCLPLGCRLETPDEIINNNGPLKTESGGLIKNKNDEIKGVLKGTLFRYPEDGRKEVWNGDILEFNLRKEPTFTPDAMELRQTDITVGVEIEGGVVDTNGQLVDVNNGDVPYIPEQIAGRRKELMEATTELAVKPTTSFDGLVYLIGQAMALESNHWSEKGFYTIWNGILPHIPELNGFDGPSITNHPYVERMVEYLSQFNTDNPEALGLLHERGYGQEKAGVKTFFSHGVHAHCGLPTDDIDFAPYAMNFTGGAAADVKAGLLASTPHWEGRLTGLIDCRWPTKTILNTACYHGPYEKWDAVKPRILEMLGRGEIPAIDRGWMNNGAQHGVDRLRTGLLTSEDMRPVTHPVPEAIAAIAYTRVADMWLAYRTWQAIENGEDLPDGLEKFYGIGGGYQTKDVWKENQRRLAENAEKAVVLDNWGQEYSLQNYIREYLQMIRALVPKTVMPDYDYERCRDILMRLSRPTNGYITMRDYCNPDSANFCTGSLGRIVARKHREKGEDDDWQAGWETLKEFAKISTESLERFL